MPLWCQGDFIVQETQSHILPPVLWWGKRKIALLTLLILLMSSAKLLDGLTDLDQRRERNSDNTDGNSSNNQLHQRINLCGCVDSTLT